MKTKNVMLGVAAAIFAVGGAVASTLLPVTHVKVGSPSVCTPINPVECGSGQLACQVIIDGTTYTAYRDAACTLTQSTTRATPFPATFK
jgi:hypothetical protein